jgi:voltage-gated potassium channel
MNGVAGIRWAFALCCLVIIAGTIGYHFIEGWSYMDSLYMTIIGVTTVGFGAVHEMDSGGRLFTMGLVLVGVVTLGYTASRLAAVMISGEIQQVMRGRSMEKRLSRLRDHVILCGYGKIGREIAREFQKASVSLCLVDADEQAVEEALDTGLLAFVGDATDSHVLERAGIHNARGLMTALPKDSDNLFVVLTAKELHPGIQVVTRGLEPNSEARLRRAGADHVISPYVIGGKRMAAVLLNPEIIDFLDIFMKQDEVGYTLSRVQVGKNSKLVGKSFAEARMREVSEGAMVLGLTRDGQSMPLPTASTVLRAGDVLVVLGQSEMLERLNAVLA